MNPVSVRNSLTLNVEAGLDLIAPMTFWSLDAKTVSSTMMINGKTDVRDLRK